MLRTDLDDVSPISAITARPGETVTGAASDQAPTPCAECGGVVGDDGYCTQCGTKAPSARDHFEEQPAPWVAGVCDRGIRHYRNEDAMALAVEADRAVLVVCDGVSNTVDSDVALAGSSPKQCSAMLRPPLPRGLGVPESAAAAVSKVVHRRGRRRQPRGRRDDRRGRPEPAVVHAGGRGPRGRCHPLLRDR